MNFIFVLINTFLGSYLAKYFFYRIYQEEFSKNVFAQEFLKKYFFIPFSSTTIKSKIKSKAVLSEILGFIVFFIFSLGCWYFYKDNEMGFLEIFVHYASYFAIITTLLYLAIFDLLTYRVPESLTKKLLFFGLVLNIVIGGVRYITFRTAGEAAFKNIHLGNIDNLVFYILLALATILFVKISKEKGIGAGDVDILGVIGLSLGWPFSLISLALTFIIGSIVSIVYALKIQKFKGVIVPLVPFILIGFTVAINFSDLIISLILS